MLSPDDFAGLVVEAIRGALAPALARVKALEAEAAELRTDLREAREASGTAILERALDLATVRERVAVLETRAPVPGPAGRDGVDGVGFDTLEATLEGDRTLVFTVGTGDRAKAAGSVVLPILVHKGIWREADTYVRGDVATWAGSSWHCKAVDTTAMPGNSPDWVQMVNRGRDGKDAGK